MSGPLGRILTNLADRFLTEKLASNHTFQQFAAKSVHHVNKVKNLAAEKGEELLSKSAAQGESRSFMNALGEEMMKDLRSASGGVRKSKFDQ